MGVLLGFHRAMGETPTIPLMILPRLEPIQKGNTSGVIVFFLHFQGTLE